MGEQGRKGIVRKRESEKTRKCEDRSGFLVLTLSRFTFHVSPFASLKGKLITFHASRITHHAIRNTQYILRRWIWFVLFAFLACGAPPLVVPEPGTMATDFTLTDQYDTKFRLSQFRGEDVLMLGCDKDSMEQEGAWQNLFREQYAQRLRILPIVNVSGLPFFARLFLKGRMKAALREEAGEPRPPSILLDWDGNVSKRYGMRPQTCTVVLIDRSGQVRFVQPLGQIDEAGVQATFEMINQQISH